MSHGTVPLTCLHNPDPALAYWLQVLEAIALGRATLGKIRQNLAWALVYNLFGIPLAAGALLPFAGIILNPAVAGGMMAFRYIPLTLLWSCQI